MKKKITLFVVLVVTVCLFPGFATAGKTQITSSKPGQSPSYDKNSLKVDLDFGKFPLHFIANKGQVNKKARFYASASRYTLWLTKEGLIFDSTHPTAPGQSSHHAAPAHKLGRDVSRLRFVGANKNPEISALEKAKLKVNYFIGSDNSKWQKDVPTSLSVLYKDIYKDIDLEVYGIEKQIEYDWIVKPKADPAKIKFRYDHVKDTRIDKSGDLIIKTQFGNLVHKKPFAYQKPLPNTAGGQNPASQKDMRIPVEAAFKKVGKNTYGFVLGEYDKSRELVIDPVVLAYSTFLGGGNNDGGFAIAVDSSGYIYIGGYTHSPNFPVLNQYQTFQLRNDGVVSIIDPTKSGADSLLYSTFLGGSGQDNINGIGVDGSGYIYVAGKTSSTNFPTLNQYQAHQGSFDCFVTVLDPNLGGSSSLLYSTYVGGEGYEESFDLAVDNSGYAYITGYTDSTAYPVLNQYQAAQGLRDVFVTKIDTTQSGSASLLYSTYLGGVSYDLGTGIATDGTGNVYLIGHTEGSDFPTLNQYQGDQGGSDAIVTKIDTTQTGAASLLYSTYLGGGSADYGQGIAVDGAGIAYVTGYSSSFNFPTLNQYQEIQGENDAFVTKIDASQSGAASLLYSTFLGGTDQDYGWRIAVDNSGSAYITGHTESTDFPILHQHQAHQGIRDVFVAKVDTTQTGASSLSYSTYLGGADEENGFDIAIDNAGYAYVTGNTSSSDFPVVNQYQTHGGVDYNDIFITKLSPATAIIITAPNGGEAWQAGSIKNITWDTVNVSGLLKIVLIKDGAKIGDIADYVDPASGSYAWTVGQTNSAIPTSPGTGYTIKIKEKGSGLVDRSDASFSIVSLELTSPNGGETWGLGAAQDITWNASGLTGLLKITLWKDSALVGTIAANLDPTSGSFAWNVGQHSGGTAEAGSGCTIKIKEKGTAVVDESDAPFNLVEPSLTVTAPNGGESWLTGSTQNITWDAPGITGLLKITLWKDGVLVGTIAANLDPASGSFSWTAGQHSGGTAPAGSGYTIKIKEKGATEADISDSPFSLTN